MGARVVSGVTAVFIHVRGLPGNRARQRCGPPAGAEIPHEHRAPRTERRTIRLMFAWKTA
jgi:hypothetical protein